MSSSYRHLDLESATIEVADSSTHSSPPQAAGHSERISQTSPKGLQLGFGVTCIEKDILLNLVQRWLGLRILPPRRSMPTPWVKKSVALQQGYRHDRLLWF